MTKKIGILTSGGDCAGLNAVIRAVTLRAINKYGWKVYGIKDGTLGLISDNINIIESGLFHRFDATNILNENLASVVTSIGLDHTDWLPKNERTIDKIIFEKTSSL